MALLDTWRSMAYDTKNNDRMKMQQMWNDYFKQEKRVYQELLKNPDEVVKGTVKELAEKYKLSIMKRIPKCSWALIRNCCTRTW